MTKSTLLSLWVSVTILVITSCSLRTPNVPQTSQTQQIHTVPPVITPTSQLSPAASFNIHYSPPEGSYIHLEFEYPASWIFSEGLYTAFSLLDPRFEALGPSSPDNMHPTPNDFGSIVVWIKPGKSTLPDAEIETLQQSYSGNFRYTVLGSYKIVIDGSDASVLEYKFDQPDFPSIMFNKIIFFVVGDQLYEIDFAVAEKDRGEEFEQGYEHFLKSIEIVP